MKQRFVPLTIALLLAITGIIGPANVFAAAKDPTNSREILELEAETLELAAEQDTEGVNEESIPEKSIAETLDLSEVVQSEEEILELTEAVQSEKEILEQPEIV